MKRFRNVYEANIQEFTKVTRVVPVRKAPRESNPSFWRPWKLKRISALDNFD